MWWLYPFIIAGISFGGNFDLQPNYVNVQSQTGEQVERFNQTFPLNQNGRVSLNNLNGSVIVETWNRNEARVEYVKTVDCDSPLPIKVMVEATSNYLRVETEYPKNENVMLNNDRKSGKSYSYGYGYHCRKADVDYKLTVPASARIDQIETVNGSVSLSNLTDYVKTSTVNGNVTARNVRGSLLMSAVNGTLNASFDSFDNVREVKLSMVNGAINLQLPQDADATVKADTVNGSIRNEFGLPVFKGEYVGRNLYGKIGDGNVSVKLSGVNGSINLRKTAGRSNGGNAKPVVNLLPARRDQNDDGDNDDDDDNNGTARVRPPRPPRVPNDGDPMTEDITESITEANRVSNSPEVKKAMRDAKIYSDKAMRQASEAMATADFSDLQFNNSQTATRVTDSIKIDGSQPRLLKVNARGGAVNIRGWDKAEIAYTLIAPKNVTATIADQPDRSVALSVTNGDNAAYRLEIFVPRATDLRVTTNRQMRVENVKGKIELDGADAAIDVRDAAGQLTIATNECGSARVIGFDGAARVKSGNIALEGNFTSLETAANGTTILTLTDAQTARIEADAAITFDRLSAKTVTADNSNVWQIGNGATVANFKLQSLTNQPILIRSRKTVFVN